MEGYEPLEAGPFSRGLDLSVAVDAVEPGYAIDAADTVYDNRGAVEAREGTQLTSADVAEVPSGWLGNYDDTDLLAINDADDGAEIFDSAGAAAGTAALGAAFALGDAGICFCHVGRVNSEELWVAGAGQLQFWNGAAWAGLNDHDVVDVDGTIVTPNVAGPKPRVIVQDPQSFRLIAFGYDGVADGPNGAASDPAIAYISEPGLPHQWNTTDNFIRLRPGDGEKAMGGAIWQDRVFLFKETVFFVMTGESIVETGAARFHRQAVAAGVGPAAAQLVAAGRRGVYIVGRDGIYLTNGGVPQLLSQRVEGLFTGRVSEFFTLGVIDWAKASSLRVHFHRDRLYLAYCSTSAAGSVPDRLLVYDTLEDWWSINRLSVVGMATLGDELVFQTERPGGYAIARLDPDVDGDYRPVAGGETTAIDAFHRAGWDPKGAGEVKTIRETKVWGSGLIDLEISRDFEQDAPARMIDEVDLRGSETWGDGTDPDDVWGDGSDGQVWGPTGIVRVQLSRKAVRATFFSVTLRGSVGGATAAARWAVHRVVHHLLDMREPSTTEVDR